MQRFRWSDAELSCAAAKVAEAMLAALPSENACFPAFSDGFLQKMEKLRQGYQRSLHKQRV